MTHISKLHRTPIGFDEIREGDKLRVTYTKGRTRVASGFSMSGTDTCVEAVTVGVALHQILGKVWLTKDGYTLVHRDWQELEIDRLSETPAEKVPVKTRVPWTEDEYRIVSIWELSDERVAKRIRRTRGAVRAKRREIREGLENK